MSTYSGSLVQLCCGEGETLQTNTTGMCGDCRSVWTTLVLPKPKAVCTSHVHTAQEPGCSTRALCQVGPAFHALPRSQLLRLSGALQGHRSRWAVRFVPFLGPSCSGGWVHGERTVPGGPCILCISLAAVSWVHHEGTASDVPLSPLGCSSGCDTPG